MIHEFLPIARAVIGLSDLKIISFGPRPMNFLACNAPIKQLDNLGVEIEENSELDLFEAFNKHAGDERIPAVVADMEKELDHRFCRVGRSMILNLNRIQRVTKTEARLSDGTALPLPRGAYEPLNRAIIQHT